MLLQNIQNHVVPRGSILIDSEEENVVAKYSKSRCPSGSHIR